jgi:threonine dehydrogenase-like Zn-dependent dehydrogenase
MGYQISCSSNLRAAYGWQRNGGHAEFILANEKDLVLLPESLSYIDGALCACGFGTSYEALNRVNISGNDRILVIGLGPVGLAALMLARKMGATRLIGVDTVQERVDLAKRLNLLDLAFLFDSDVLKRILQETDGTGSEVSVDCSGNPAGRLLAIQGTRQWGRTVFVGEGGTVQFEPSRDIIHKQITIYGSWVTSLSHLEDLVEKLVQWDIHPEATVTHTFSLDQAAEAYKVMDEGKCGKVVIV